MPTRPLVALVALRDLQMPSESRLFEALGQLRPEYQVSQVEHKEEAIVFRIDGHLAAVSLMPHPIAGPALAVSCANAWYWPEAAEAMRDHAAHVLVAVQPEAADQVPTAVALTAVAAAVASTAPAVGVYWSANGLVHSPEAFVTYAQQMTPQSLPVLLWIHMVLHKEADGSHSVYTTGLREFNQMELEVHGSLRDPQFLLGRVYDIVHYLLEKNAILHHGETIGTTNEEQIAITVGPSSLDPSTEVVHLGL